MAISHKQEKLINLSINQSFQNLIERLDYELWEITHQDEFKVKDRNIKEIFGISAPFGGSGIFSFFMNGATYVPFFVKLIEVSPRKTKVIAMSGGSESYFGTDYGRNEGVVQLILSFCEKSEILE